VSLGECFPAFRRNVEGSKKNLLGPLNPDDESTIERYKSEDLDP